MLNAAKHLLILLQLGTEVKVCQGFLGDKEVQRIQKKDTWFYIKQLNRNLDAVAETGRPDNEPQQAARTPQACLWDSVLCVVLIMGTGQTTQKDDILYFLTPIINCITAEHSQKQGFSGN